MTGIFIIKHLKCNNIKSPGELNAVFLLVFVVFCNGDGDSNLDRVLSIKKLMFCCNLPFERRNEAIEQSQY